MVNINSLLLTLEVSLGRADSLTFDTRPSFPPTESRRDLSIIVHYNLFFIFLTTYVNWSWLGDEVGINQ